MSRVAPLFFVVLLSGCCGGELEARRFDLERECLGEIEDVGCGRGEDCAAQITVAESEYGSLWRFSSSCIPQDYEVVEGRFADVIFEAPLCSELSQ